jgi:hypothetical protein
MKHPLSVLLLGGAVFLGQTLRGGTVFLDDFSSSTLNSATPAPPAAGSTAYHLFSSKAWNPAPSIAANDLQFGIGPTTSGHIEAQALFATSPVALTNTGDWIELTITFVNTAGLFTQSGHLGLGLYNSGGVPPLAGGMQGTATTSTTATGGAQGWQGYVARLAYEGGTHRLATRPVQTITTANNQDLVTEGSSSMSYVGGVSLAGAASTLSLAAGTQLTAVLRLTLSGPGALQLESRLHLGADTNGVLLVSQSGPASGGNFLTNSFDALCVGWRAMANTSATLIDIQSIRVTSTALSTPGGAPVVSALSPAAGAAGLCVDTLLKTTFDRPVLLQKSGAIRIYDTLNPAAPVDTIDLSANVDNGPGGIVSDVQPRLIGGETFTNRPVVVSGATAVIHPHAGVLTTNRTYYVLMDPGVFTDTQGNVFPGISDPGYWRFTTKSGGPANSTNLVVAADGTGDFCTVQGAVDFVPAGNATPRLITIRNGVYREIVNVNNRHRLTFRGQDRAGTVIGYDNNAYLNGSTHSRMAFKVNGNDIALDTLTLTNMTPKGGSQAEALMVETDRKRLVAWNVNFCSYQDTILLNTSGSQAYFQDCLIQGDTDFIWGGGNAFFTNCEIKSLYGGYVTQARTSAGSNGMSFVNCRLTRTGAISASLGRSLGYADGNVAFVNCLMDSHITGWTDANPRYWEHGNSNLAATAAVAYNGTQLAAGSLELAHARSAVLWLNGWTPSLLPTILVHPTNQTVAAGQPVVLAVSAFGIPAPAYQWLKNGVNLAGATNATYSIPSPAPSDSGTYAVVVTTPAGAVVSSNAVLVVTAPHPPAFPGAEGAGANAVGGRGGDVYYVTTLADSGAGSLRAGISSAPATGRTIVFAVSGNIVLNSTLTVNRPRITIAGQTAPGDGICLQNYAFNIGASEVIVRHLRTRLGTNAMQEADCMWINSGTNIVVDHVSASWSVDEVLSASGNVGNLTVQWCYIAEALNNSIHSKGAHGYGSLITPSRNGTLSWHHNLYAHNNSRNPRPGTDSAATVIFDFRNNVIYNYGSRAGYGSDWDPDPENLRMNYVGNYIVAGPSSSYSYAFQGGGTNTMIYQENNLIDLDKDNAFDGLNNNWGMFSGTYVPTNTPFPAPPVTAEAPAVALQRVLALGGAMPWRRDAADQRVVATARAHTGQIIDAVAQVGTWPVLASVPPPTDADSDGMPDYWELAVGLNPLNAADRNVTNVLTGYTRLEEYLNWLADPHAICPRNGQVEVSLRALTGEATNLAYVVSAGTNGSVALLADGFTARFTSVPDYNGLASFAFTARDSVNGVTFGPVTVGVLISTTNANHPPVLAPVTNRTAVAGQTVSFVCSATDPEVPPQTLTFSLLNAPDGAALDPGSGQFHWRPAIAQGGATYDLAVVAADNGSPSLSATQHFSITVLRPARPSLQGGGFTSNRFALGVTGDAGPDYLILASSNLTDWAAVFATNAPLLPFWWTDPESEAIPQRFYRVLLGP